MFVGIFYVGGWFELREDVDCEIDGCKYFDYVFWKLWMFWCCCIDVWYGNVEVFVVLFYELYYDVFVIFDKGLDFVIEDLLILVLEKNVLYMFVNCFWWIFLWLLKDNLFVVKVFVEDDCWWDVFWIRVMNVLMWIWVVVVEF